MSTEIQIHEFQISILRELLFKPNARFRDLNILQISNDHFTFHLKKLVKDGLIIKNNGVYSLSDSGKEFANRMDTDSLKIEKQGKLAIAIHAIRTKNGETETLVHQRLKEPFYGWYGSHSGKVKWGESPLECAKREFFEETGLIGDFKLKAILHIINCKENGEILEDKYLWVFIVTNTTGKLVKRVKEGRNIWMNEMEYRKLKNTFGSWDGIMKEVKTKEIIYKDKKNVVNSF